MGTSSWSAEQWGILIAIVLAVVSWCGTWIWRRHQERVDVIVGGFSFHTGAQGLNPPWTFSLGLQIANLGPGIARDLAIGTLDPERRVFSEWAQWPVLGPAEPFVTYLGLHEETPDDDPSAEQAWDFYQRAIVMIVCWDRLGRVYEFFSEGGGKVRRSRAMWRTPKEMHDFMRDVDPPRGEPPRARGAGRPLDVASRGRFSARGAPAD